MGGEGSLLRRASAPLFDALARADVELEWPEPSRRGGWPARVRAIGPPSRLRLERPASSQEASALLVALSAWPGEGELEVEGAIPSRPYVEMTCRVLAEFGARVRVEDRTGGARFAVKGPLVAPEEPIVIEPDASSAAVALAAACLSGGRVVVPGLRADSAQPDARVIGHLERFGCRAGAGEEGLWAEGFPSRGAELDLSEAPDLAPVLAAIAGAAAIRAGGRSRLAGLATLPGKESSRIEVLARGLSALGLEVEPEADSLSIASGRASSPGGEVVLDPKGDHRMVFAFALLGLVRGNVWVADPGCAAKSWPGFWEDLERLGARVERREG